MKFLTTALSLFLLLAGALARPPPASLTTETGDPAPLDPQDKRANLTEVLTLDGPFRTFLKYLQEANLVAVFENQAYRTDQGITIFVPVDMAFSAVKPSVLAGLSRNQMKHLMMYHSLAKHYALGEFEGLSQSNPVTTLAGGQYAVNVTYDGGIIHVKSRWANAKVVGSVYETAPMAVYEVDRVLLPDALFRAHPPVADTPPAPPPPSAEEGAPPEDGAGLLVPSSDGFAPPPAPGKGHSHGDHAEWSASRAAVAHRPASRATAVALGAAALVVL